MQLNQTSNPFDQIRIAASDSGLFVPVYENDLSAFIPQLWAAESLMILVENMVAGNLVYRDFENLIANYGDTVNARRPNEFQAKRKILSDNVVVQDATATNIPVKLDQHVHTSFLIRDGEESKSFVDLVEQYLKPAVIAQARFIDQMVLGQYVQFLGNYVGGPGAMTTTNAKSALLSARQIMNVNKAPVAGRNLILNPFTETTLLNLDIFITAQTVGDQGEAMKNASLGRKMGFDMYMDQNMPAIVPGSTTAADTLSAGAAAGATSIVLTTGTAPALVAGNWITIAGDDAPHQITTWTSGTKTAIISPPLRTAITTGAAVAVYAGGTVNNASGYAAGYAKEITVAGFTVAPQVGQMITFGGDTTRYSILAVNGTIGVTLDRPLVNALTNAQTVSPGPAGNFNFAFHENAIALVVRPLSPPKPGTGALSATINDNGLSMRATITYDGNKQGHLVTLDLLCGIAVLDTRLGAVMIG